MNTKMRTRITARKINDIVSNAGEIPRKSSAMLVFLDCKYSIAFQRTQFQPINHHTFANYLASSSSESLPFYLRLAKISFTRWSERFMPSRLANTEYSSLLMLPDPSLSMALNISSGLALPSSIFFINAYISGSTFAGPLDPMLGADLHILSPTPIPLPKHSHIFDLVDDAVHDFYLPIT